MARDPQLELRTSRLENDIRAIYDLVTEVISTQREHSDRLVEIDRRFVRVEGRFDGIAGTLAEVLRRLPEPA